MNRKAKGTNAERELVKMFWDNGWAALRTPASGAARFPCPDIIASNKIRQIAVECKAVKGKNKYFSQENLEGLKGFCPVFGAEPWIGLKFNNQKWLFIPPEDLNKTKGGFSITLNSAKMKGVLFEDLIQKKRSDSL